VAPGHFDPVDSFLAARETTCSEMNHFLPCTVLAKGLYDLAAEGGDVLWLAARNELCIDGHLLVSASILKVGMDGWPRGHGLTLNYIRFN
jgi:hypothetical protein